jgi:hypothetical protein
MPHWLSRTRQRRPRQIRRGQPSSPVERIPEILEALFLNEPKLTKAVLAELDRADTATLVESVGARLPWVVYRSARTMIAASSTLTAHWHVRPPGAPAAPALHA